MEFNLNNGSYFATCGGYHIHQVLYGLYCGFSTFSLLFKTCYQTLDSQRAFIGVGMQLNFLIVASWKFLYVILEFH